MPKNKDADPTIIDDADDEGLEIDLTPSRKFKGTDGDPIDAETGEPEFEDLTPRLRDVHADDEDEDGDERDEEEEDEDKDDLDEEDEDEREEEEEEDDEDDRPRRGKRRGWQSRLDRERRLREEEQETSRELRERLDRLEANQRIQADEEKFSREKAEIEVKMADIKTQLEQAIEDGESKQVADLQDKLMDLKVDLRAKESLYQRAKTEAEQAAKTKKNEPSSIIVRKVRQWVRKHPKYNRDQIFQNFVKGVDRVLIDEGFDPETEEFYEELDRRVKRRYPEEYKHERASKRRDEDEPRRRKHPSANMRRESERGPTKKIGDFEVRGGKVRLTPRQVANMRKFQLDPTNKADVAEYINSNR